MRLSHFILQEKEAILQAWEDFAGSIEPPNAHMTRRGLRDHAALILDTIVADLDTPQSASEQARKALGRGRRTEAESYAEVHAAERLRAGYTINQLVSEYRALRASVLELWARDSAAVRLSDPADMTRFNEAIDQALAESVARYCANSSELGECSGPIIVPGAQSRCPERETGARGIDEIAAALRVSEAKFRTIANAMPQMVWSALPDGFHDYYNQQWYDFTGVPANSTDGEGWAGVFHAEDQPAAWDLWRRSLTSGDTYEVHYRLRHRSGQYRWTLGRALPVRDDGGAIIRWMGTCTDIHDQKLAEEKLLEANRRKDEFLAMLAHELRNPLAPIASAAQILKMPGIGPEEVHRSSAVILRQVKHMTDLVDDLLDVSRVTRGLIVLDNEALDLKLIVASAIEQVRPLIEARHHELHLRMAPGPTFVRGDRTRLVQVVANLLNNAAKYTPHNGKLSLAMTLHQGQVTLAVGDNGSGIAPTLLPYIFDLFTQGERTSDRAQGGLGLGLSLVKSISALHGGQVTAHSDGPGAGSTFTVTLPVLAGLVQATAPGTAAGAALAVRGRTLMVVDDNADAAFALAALLEMQGHRVSVQEDAAGALAAPERGAVDVFILDIGLPGMDGFELVRRLRRDPCTAGAVFIALTGYGQAQDRMLSKAAGFDHHFVKPVEAEQLAAVLAALP